MTKPSGGSMNRLDGLLARAAASNPDRPAVIFGDVSWTYAQLLNRAQRLASALAAMGVGYGDRVAFWASNRSEFLEALFGVPILGAIAVPLDHWWSGSDAMSALAQVRPKVLIIGKIQAVHLESKAEELQAIGLAHVVGLDEPFDSFSTVYEHLLANAAPLQCSDNVSADDPALILFTSGSTGRSKGAVHSHRGLYATAMTMSIELGLRDGERTLHCLPLFSSCLEHLIPLTLMRSTHVILPNFDGPATWSAIEHHKITHLNAVPTTLRRLLDDAPNDIPQSLRLITYASEPMPSPLIKALIRKAPEVQFVQFYGMIEHLCLTVLGALEQISNIGSVGRPMITSEIRIVTEDGLTATPGETGEILARTPTQFDGYWEDSVATAQVVQDGWMRTGDLGHFNEDGVLILSGRLKEVIKSGGLTVIPSQVEAVLLTHDTVREAAVVGIPDERWGEAVHAFVVLHSDKTVSEPDVISFCRERLSGYKTPKAIHFVSDLPRTGIGKVSRRSVRERFLQTQTTW